MHNVYTQFQRMDRHTFELPQNLITTSLMPTSTCSFCTCIALPRTTLPLTSLSLTHGCMPDPESASNLFQHPGGFTRIGITWDVTSAAAQQTYLEIMTE